MRRPLRVGPRHFYGPKERMADTADAVAGGGMVGARPAPYQALQGAGRAAVPEGWRKAAMDGRSEAIAEGGHRLPEEPPETVAARLRAFLALVATGSCAGRRRPSAR